MKKDMDNCLIETLQVSDYNEMMERCDSVKRSNETINGYIESSINLDSSALITKVIETEPFKQQKRFGLEINEPVSTTIDKNGTLELLTKYFQRGIHSQLDLFTEINLHTFDSLFTRTLAMRGIIYLPHRIEIVNLRQDSTVVQGLSSPQKYRPGKEAVSYYYNYDLYNKMAYRLWVEPTNTIVLQQMKGILYTSFFIIIILGLSFWFLIRIILRQKSVEEMKEDFTHNITHELKTPLTSISGYAEIIASGLVKPDDIPNFANKIHKESGRLLSLISDIMELSQLDEKFSDEEFAPVDLAGVATEVAEDLRSNAEKHGITITVDTKTAVINGNRNQIYELIYNLCDNAIRYNRENGSVKIITGDDNEHPFVKVADTGIGIPEKHHKRVFERFYRVDKSRSKETGGTGLGLAIVKHITERHGGEISLESSEQGTTFTAMF